MTTLCRQRPPWCVLVLALCTCNGHMVTEDSFAPRTDVELEAKARMQHWVAVADTWVIGSTVVSEDHRAQVSAAIKTMRASLSRYNELRRQGSSRAMIIAPIKVSAAGIVADDATGVGIGNDVLLAPLALAAVATYLVTDARAAEHQLGQAWNQVLTDSSALAHAVESALVAAGMGTREDCIAKYVDCQQNARRSFPRGRCQVCMDRCIVSDFIWPREEGCKYL